jgi:hypothetical protein
MPWFILYRKNQFTGVLFSLRYVVIWRKFCPQPSRNHTPLRPENLVNKPALQSRAFLFFQPVPEHQCQRHKSIPLRDNLFRHNTRHIGQAEIPPAILIGQFLVVKSQ